MAIGDMWPRVATLYKLLQDITDLYFKRSMLDVQDMLRGL